MQEKIVLITGVSSGIGRCIADLLNNRGYIVYGVSRRLNAMLDLKDMGVRVIPADVTNDAQVKKVIDTIMDEHGRIDVLINNAGKSIYGALEEVPISEAKDLFDLNVFAYTRLIQFVLPNMRKRRQGLIINMSSVGGFVVIPSNGWYCASKSAIEALTDSLRMEVRNLGINVVLIEPEIINTNFGQSALKASERISHIDDYEFFSSRKNQIVKNSVGKGSSPELVARKVLTAIEKKNPKTRYFVPGYSKILPIFKRMIPDHWVDKISLYLFNYISR